MNAVGPGSSSISTSGALAAARAAARRLLRAAAGEVDNVLLRSAVELDTAIFERWVRRDPLRQRVGREVAVELSVDPALLGGLVVRIGSQMIDSSIRTRLNALASAMRG